ncbi:MAG: FAD-binding oxidoreductase [Desulfobacterales bacterium]|nr:MAG: FAD-binding oxidoreductase [Desulfobacterales bacterium]
MRRWNGWGDVAVSVDLPPAGIHLLHRLLGAGRVQPDFPLDDMLARVPPTRLPAHPRICFDPKARLDHAHGQSLPDWIRLRGGILNRFPDGVAQPTSIDEVQALLHWAAEQEIIVIPYGGGTSVVGHLEVPETKRPVLSLSLERLNRLLSIDADSRLATFEAGVCGPDLENQLQPRGFTLGHYPQSFEYSSLGGWVVTRSCGQQSRYFGRIEQIFAGGEVLTPRGPLRLPPYSASAAGPDLRQFVLGSEGRLGILTKVIVKISPLPERDDIEGVFFPSWDHGIQAVRNLAGSGVPLSMVRLSNAQETFTQLALAGHEAQIRWLYRYLKLRGIPSDKTCLCLLGFIGSGRLVRAARRESLAIVGRYKGVSVGRRIGEVWKKNRFRSAYLRNALWDRGYAVDTVETAVNWGKVTATMTAMERALQGALESLGEHLHAFTHLSHIYPTGSGIYTTFVFRLADTPLETLRSWQVLKQAVSQAIVDAGGTISHQHGVGGDHRRYLQAEKGKVGIRALQHLFSHFDPDQRMNPAKLLP